MIDIETPATATRIVVVSSAGGAAIACRNSQVGRKGIAAVALIASLDAKVSPAAA